MKIAVYLGADGVPVSLYARGALHIYEDEGGDGAWRPRAELAFHLDARMRLGGVKAAVADLARALKAEHGDCRVLLSGEIRGLPYSLLQEEHGFTTWRSEGDLPRQLDFVRARETEAAARKKYEIVLRASQPTPAPVRIRDDGLHDNGGGHYWIDLRAALEHASNPTSRNILIPFLAAGHFGKLEVLCDHLPKWMAWEFERMDLAAETEAIDATGVGLKVTVYSRRSPEGRHRPRGLANAAALPCLPCPRDAQRRPALPHPGRHLRQAADIIDVEPCAPDRTPLRKTQDKQRIGK
ncbi:MAG: Fe-only nitrogenase accessory protein AnfO [Azoarcus sp.]|jgi:Fe-only nitrogenase accessory protein AnfO|nr:Fe-only nitrogenase accessory protein AnfO [Azoarcus sp.]